MKTWVDLGFMVDETPWKAASSSDLARYLGCGIPLPDPAAAKAEASAKAPRKSLRVKRG